MKLTWACSPSSPGASRRWARILGDPANWGAPPGQLPGCPGELGGPAEPISFGALQHCGPALNHPASRSGPTQEQHTGHGSQPAGLRHRPREGNNLPAVSGEQEMDFTDGFIILFKLNFFYCVRYRCRTMNVNSFVLLCNKWKDKLIRSRKVLIICDDIWSALAWHMLVHTYLTHVCTLISHIYCCYWTKIQILT